MRLFSGLLGVLTIGFAATATAQDATDTTTYFLPSMQGSPIVALAEDGQLLWTQVYSPLGFREGSGEPETSAAANRIGYTGHVEDKLSARSLVYMQARYYDPTIGSFLSVDSVGFRVEEPVTFNRYAYAHFNPLKYIDPDGNDIDFVYMNFPGLFMSDIAPSLYGTDTSTREGTYEVLKIMQQEAFFELFTMGLEAGLGRLSAPLARVSGPVRKSAASRLADKVRPLPAQYRPNTVAVIRHRDGTLTIGRNSGGVQNPIVQNLLDKTPINCFAGQCAEMNALARGYNRGRNMDGATMSISHVRGNGSGSGLHGTPKTPCTTCQNVIDQLNIGQ